MVIRSIARKELRILLRDRLSAGILLGMPLLFIALLGLLLGEGFGHKADDSLRITVVDLDEGMPELKEGGAFPYEKWSNVVIRDLRAKGRIRVERVATLEEAERLVNESKRAAVVVFKPDFSRRVAQCSFLADGTNPFFENGVYLDKVGIDLIADPTQKSGGAIISQVTQVTLLRVILPYMIGQAFEKLGDPNFVEKLGEEITIFGRKLNVVLTTDELRGKVGEGVQRALAKQFPKFNLTGKTWDALTKAEGDAEERQAELTSYANRDGIGFLNRGAARYQILVPAYTVMFAFSLVLTVGWLFVLERRQGTLTRLRAAPVTRSQILLGKFLPCFVISVLQGIFLLTIGKLVFDMSWGAPEWSIYKQGLMLLPVVVCTSLAAMGLSLFVAALTRTEMQVALIGSLLVLVLGLLSGCLIPREILPEAMNDVSRITPHAWALDAYRQLLVQPAPGMEISPNLDIVRRSCLVLTGFGVGFLVLAWGLIRLR